MSGRIEGSRARFIRAREFGEVASPRSRNRERGFFTLVEVLLATLILALSATATAYWVETVSNLGRDSDEQTIGLSVVQVLEGLLSPLPYREPDGVGFGAEAGESLLTFDDLDDFHGLVSSPPLNGDRAPQLELGEWTTRITVTEVDPITLQPGTNTDLRMVRIEVERAGREITKSWWLRARAPTE